MVSGKSCEFIYADRFPVHARSTATGPTAWKNVGLLFITCAFAGQRHRQVRVSSRERALFASRCGTRVARRAIHYERARRRITRHVAQRLEVG